MRVLYVLARDEHGLRELAVVSARRHKLALQRQAHYEAAGYSTKIISAFDLDDAMRSYPALFRTGDLS